MGRCRRIPGLPLDPRQRCQQRNYDEQVARAADGLARLTEIAEKAQLSVIVENHGGLSSNGAWLASVMQKVGHPHCGTLPDFGNFRVSKDEMYDRYKGVTELMPFAHAVSAKSHDFDEQGNEIHTDYRKMMQIVLDAGYAATSESNTKAARSTSTPESGPRRSCWKRSATSCRRRLIQDSQKRSKDAGRRELCPASFSFSTTAITSAVANCSQTALFRGNSSNCLSPFRA